ncbi:MAG: HEAT repeat domain-containing protein [Planctomycetia bacterium]|nr:HEAT repeat domain-containing protein [Planctomycetia bacterium]
MSRSPFTLTFPTTPIVLFCIAGIIGTISLPVVRADTVYLKNGGRVVGTIPDPKPASRTTIVQLVDGGAVALTNAEIERVERETPAAREFERLSRKCPDTVEAHFALAEWCRRQPSSDQVVAQGRMTHLNRILDLDPDHEKARQALGYIRVDGVWTTREAEMERQGRTYYRGRWVTPQERELDEKKRAEKQTARNWWRQIRTLCDNIGGSRHDEAKRRLETLKDPAAIPAIERTLIHGNASLPVRVLLIRALSSIGTAEALDVLADVAVDDPVEEVRLASLDYLKKHPGTTVAAKICQRFSERDNPRDRIERIGFALGELNDPGSIGPLIDHLVTVHRVLISSGSGGGGAGTMSMAPTFSSGGATSGGGFTFGGGGPKYEKRQSRNRRVHEALVKIVHDAGYPDVDYGYNVDAWRQWFAVTNRVNPFDARRNP